MSINFDLQLSDDISESNLTIRKRELKVTDIFDINANFIRLPKVTTAVLDASDTKELLDYVEKNVFSFSNGIIEIVSMCQLSIFMAELARNCDKFILNVRKIGKCNHKISIKFFLHSLYSSSWFIRINRNMGRP